MHLGRVHAILDPDDAAEFVREARIRSSDRLFPRRVCLAVRSVQRWFRESYQNQNWVVRVANTSCVVVRNKESQRALREHMQSDDDDDVVDNLRCIRTYAKNHDVGQGPTGPNILALLAFDIELEDRWASGERCYLKYPAVLAEIAHLALCTEVSSSAFTAFEFARLQAGSFAEVMTRPVANPGTTKDRVNALIDQTTLLHSDEATTSLPDDAPFSLLPHQCRTLRFCCSVEDGEASLFMKVREGLYYSPYMLRFSQTPRLLRGGFVCDEMGLGKTAVSLALVHAKPPPSSHQGANTLVVCPVSLIGQWCREARKCFPGVSIAKYHGPNRRRLTLFDKNIVVTTYGILASEARSTHSNHENRLDTVVWHRVVFDEAHVLRNMNTVQYRVCTRICATHKWVVTGTPITTHDGCLSMMQTRLVFDHLRGRDMLLRGNVSCPMLALMTKTMIRHRKAMRILGRPIVTLPPCTRALAPIAMTADEKAQHDTAYQQVQLFYRRSRYYTGLQGFREVQRLRRLLSSAPSGQDTGLEVASQSLRDVAEKTIKDDCCGICLGDFDVPIVTKHCHHVFCDECMQNLFAASAHKCPMCRTPLARSDLLLVHPPSDDIPASNFGSKISALCGMVQAAEDQDKFLVVLQFQGSMGPVRSALEDHAKVYSLESSMPQSKREKSLAAFEAVEGKAVFLLSARAGGVGVNLTAANRVVLFEPFLDKGLREQAVGRAYRMGQRRPVQVQTLVTTGTIEEKIVAQEGDCRMSHVCQFFTDDD